MKKRVKKILTSVLMFMVISPITFLSSLILISDAKISDFFTSKRVSFLEKRKDNITKDIVVDATYISSHGGIKTLTESIIKLAASKRPDWRFVILIGNKGNYFPQLISYDNIMFLPINSRHNKILLCMRNIIDFLTLGLLHDKITQLCFYNTVCIDNKCDLFFDPYAERAINDFSIPKVSLIHDVIYFDHPVFRASSTGRWIENVSDSIIKFSGKIITVSDFSKQKIIKYHRVKEDLVKVIHIRPNIIKSDVSPDFTDSVLKKYELKKNNYLIYVSSFWPHKNHLRLLEAFSKFVSSSDSDVKLALVGTFDIEKNPDSYKSVLLEKGLYGRVVFTYQVSDQELKALLPNALAFVFPSIYEGFGIPAVEAMAAGVPLICSNTGSLPEIAGNAALFFDPYNTDEIAAAISEIVGNSDLRGKLIRLGYEQAKKFADPDVMVNEYIKVFEEVMK